MNDSICPAGSSNGCISSSNIRALTRGCQSSQLHLVGLCRQIKWLLCLWLDPCCSTPTLPGSAWAVWVLPCISKPSPSMSCVCRIHITWRHSCYMPYSRRFTLLLCQQTSRMENCSQHSYVARIFLGPHTLSAGDAAMSAAPAPCCLQQSLHVLEQACIPAQVVSNTSQHQQQQVRREDTSEA